MHEPTLDQQAEWATAMWNMLRDNGIWGIPRSGLMYRKDKERARLTLYERMPWMEGMPLTREELLAEQDSDHGGLVVLFAIIGVEVVDDTHSRNVRENEGGGS
jgi:hypothetical protein